MIPYFPQTIAPGTVLGRLAAGAGPVETISFPQLAAQLTLNTAVVATVSALRALAPPATATIAITLGYYAAADGGGFQYVWSATDTASDNGGSIIAPNAGGTGRWHLVNVGFVNVQQFGAGFGSSDDSAAIQAAINSVSESGAVVFPYTTFGYKIGTGLVVASDRVSLVGMGHPRIYTAAAIALLTLGNGLSGSRKRLNRVTGLWFDGAAVATTGIQTNGVREFVIDDCRIQSVAGSGIDIAKPGTSGDFAGRVRDCLMILNQWAIRTHADNNQLLFDGLMVENNSSGGIWLDSDAGDGSTGVMVQRSTLQNNNNVQLKIENTTAWAVDNCYFECGQAAATEFGTPGNGNSTDRAIKIGTSAIAAQGRISNNFMSSQGGIQTYPIEVVSAHGLTVCGNQAGGGITGYSTGLLLSTSVSDGTWFDNYYDGSTEQAQPSNTTGWAMFIQGRVLGWPTAYGGAPSLGTISGIGSTGTATLETGSLDSAGTIVITAGGSGISSAGSLTLTLARNPNSNNTMCLLQAADNTGSWNTRVALRPTSITGSPPAIVINWDNNSSNLSSGSIYKIHYQVMGK